MDWINCNSCCRQPGDPLVRVFMLSSCGHMFCDLCLSRMEQKDRCSVCSTSCQMIELSSKMKPDAEMFFLEPRVLMRRQTSEMQKVLDFQKEHRLRLVAFHRRVVLKYKHLEMIHSDALERIRQLELELSQVNRARDQSIYGVANNEGSVQGARLMLSQGSSCVGVSEEERDMPRRCSPHKSYQLVLTNHHSSPQSSPISSTINISPSQLTLDENRIRCQGSPLNMYGQGRNIPAGDGYMSPDSASFPASHGDCNSLLLTPKAPHSMPCLSTPYHPYTHPLHRPSHCEQIMGITEVEMRPMPFTPRTVSAVLTSPNAFDVLASDRL